uniref:Uncharacterized protein n=1 Tax=Lepeophtheirus salmonis TaxID=72036 RepID=A0A0K2UI36_LEPSM
MPPYSLSYHSKVQGQLLINCQAVQKFPENSSRQSLQYFYV